MFISVLAARSELGLVAALAMAASACGTADDPSLPAPAAEAAAQPLGPLLVSPTEGPPFTVVTVSGAGCTGPSPSVVGELERPEGDSVPGGTGAIPGASGVFFTTTPDATGSWTHSFTVPPVVAPGRYRVVAQCAPETGPQPEAYGPQPFEVSTGDSASMSLSPRQAPAGVDVVVDISGTLCRGTAPQVDVQVHPVGNEEGGEFVASAVFTPDGDGSWAGRLMIPAGPATTYVVGVVCTIGGQQFFIYLPASDTGSVPSARLVQIGGGLPPTR
jgi:hypothetical protein